MAGTVIKADTRHSGKGSRERAAEGEQMLADYNRGMRLSALVSKYGLSRATVNRRLTETINLRRRVTSEVYREQQNAELDEQTADWQRNLDAGNALIAQATTVDPETGEKVTDLDRVERGLAVRAKALEGLGKVNERRHKLNGIDAPVKAEVEVTTVTPQEKELRDLLAAAAAAQSAREATLLEDEDA